MTVDFRSSPPILPPITIFNNSVSAVETFRFLGTSISQDLKWTPNIDSIFKKAQQSTYFLRQLRKFNLPQELLIQFYTAIVQSVLCTSIVDWPPSRTETDWNGQSGWQKKSLVLNCPPSRTYTHPESGNGQEISLQTHLTLDTICLNFSPPAGATEHYTPKQPDTRTVSSPRPSQWWTLDQSASASNPLTPWLHPPTDFYIQTKLHYKSTLKVTYCTLTIIYIYNIPELWTLDTLLTSLL